MVPSYLVHFDLAGGIVSLTGSITFDPGKTIFGIQTHSHMLYSTDGPFGHPSVVYPGVFIATRAFDMLPALADVVTIAGDRNSATFSPTVEVGMDQARIFKVPAGKPSSTTLLIVGALALVLIRRMRARGW